MEFLLTTSRRWYTEAEAEKLKDLGFHFEVYEASESDPRNCWRLNTSKITLNSVDDLMYFCREYGGLLVISETGHIEIYDADRE